MLLCLYCKCLKMTQMFWFWFSNTTTPALVYIAGRWIKLIKLTIILCHELKELANRQNPTELCCCLQDVLLWKEFISRDPQPELIKLFELQSVKRRDRVALHPCFIVFYFCSTICRREIDEYESETDVDWVTRAPNVWSWNGAGKWIGVVWSHIMLK